ncbi:hypothetical protein AB595_10910 [Massilia sp. WF1]|nr:hypothetical protein AM586_08095 [Massilia sp. WG5]KLU36897.1 hypothetical protein AB595_10910 [Massilia sp. WF1]
MENTCCSVEYRKITYGVASNHANIDGLKHGVKQFSLFFKLLLGTNTLGDVIQERTETTITLPTVGADCHLDSYLPPTCRQGWQLNLSVKDHFFATLQQTLDALFFGTSEMRRDNQL